MMYIKLMIDFLVKCAKSMGRAVSVYEGISSAVVTTLAVLSWFSGQTFNLPTWLFVFCGISIAAAIPLVFRLVLSPFFVFCDQEAEIERLKHEVDSLRNEHGRPGVLMLDGIEVSRVEDGYEFMVYYVNKSSLLVTATLVQFNFEVPGVKGNTKVPAESILFSPGETSGFLAGPLVVINELKEATEIEISLHIEYDSNPSTKLRRSIRRLKASLPEKIGKKRVRLQHQQIGGGTEDFVPAQ